MLKNQTDISLSQKAEKLVLKLNKYFDNNGFYSKYHEDYIEQDYQELYESEIQELLGSKNIRKYLNEIRNSEIFIIEESEFNNEKTYRFFKKEDR